MEERPTVTGSCRSLRIQAVVGVVQGRPKAVTSTDLPYQPWCAPVTSEVRFIPQGEDGRKGMRPLQMSTCALVVVVAGANEPAQRDGEAGVVGGAEAQAVVGNEREAGNDGWGSSTCEMDKEEGVGPTHVVV